MINLPKHVYKRPQTSRHVAMPGIVQAEPRDERAPIFQHGNQPAVVQPITGRGLRYIRKAQTIGRRLNHQAVVIQREYAGNIDRHFLPVLAELPAVALAARQPLANAVVVTKVVGRGERCSSREIRGRCNDYEAKIIADAHRHHVARDRLAKPYSGIETLLNDIDEPSLRDQIDRQIATNLTGSIQVIRAALPYLRRQGGGRIVQISSEGGQIAYPNFSLYHATKWGIEGFVESVAKEVAPFGIDFVIVEPGPTSTQFGAGLDHAVPMPEYDDTPAGDVRMAIASNSFAIRGDAGKTVAAMIVAVDSAHPPLRLTLGGGAYDSISAALAERLRMLEAQKDIAFSADSID